MPQPATEPFGDPTASWVVGRMPLGWRVTQHVTLHEPGSGLTVRIERRTEGDVLPSLVFAQDSLDTVLAESDPAPVLLAGLSALPFRGVDGGGHAALLDLPGTPDVRLQAWACLDRDRITVTAVVRRTQWHERAAELMAVLESLEIPR